MRCWPKNSTRSSSASQFADEDVPTPWTFAGETLFIKAHGSGRQWKWILHCPSLHLDIGEGKLNQIIGKARLSAAYLWEREIGDILATLYDFLTRLLWRALSPPGQRVASVR